MIHCWERPRNVAVTMRRRRPRNGARSRRTRTGMNRLATASGMVPTARGARRAMPPAAMQRRRRDVNCRSCPNSTKSGRDVPAAKPDRTKPNPGASPTGLAPAARGAGIRLRSVRRAARRSAPAARAECATNRSCVPAEPARTGARHRSRRAGSDRSHRSAVASLVSRSAADACRYRHGWVIVWRRGRAGYGLISIKAQSSGLRA